MRYWKPRRLPSKPLITMVIVAYERGPQLACLINSLRAQTYTNIEVLVYHDGPISPKTMEFFTHATHGDDRFRLIVNKARQQKHGYPMRTQGLQEAKGDYVGFANDDVYYCPVYLEALVSNLLEHSSDFVYCDMVHSHTQWKMMISQLRRGHIDIGNWLVRKSLAVKALPFGAEFAADWFFISKLIQLGMRAHKVGGVFYVHN